MSINLSDELHAATTKGKIASAKEVYLEGDKENLQQIGDKTHQLEEAVKDISVTGGASTANAVSYDNSASGMFSVTAQKAIDELAAKDKSQDAEIAKKADASDVDSKMQTEQTRVNTELDKKFDKENIAQELGDSEDKTISQEVITKNLSTKVSKDDYDSFRDEVVCTNKRKVESFNKNETLISDYSEEFAISDVKGNVCMKVDKDGLKVRKLNICDNEGNVVSDIDKDSLSGKINQSDFYTELVKKLSKSNSEESTISDVSEEFAISDVKGNVCMKVDKDGLKVRKLNICDNEGNVVSDIDKDSLSGKYGNTCSLQEKKGTYYNASILSVSDNITATIDTNISKFEKSIRIECNGVEATEDTNTASRGELTLDFSDNPITVNETLGFWYFIPTKYWRPSQITGVSEKVSVDYITMKFYNGDTIVYNSGISFSRWTFGVGWELHRFLNDSISGSTITKAVLNFVSLNNSPNFQMWLGQFVADQRMVPILNFNMDNDMKGISYTSGFADWLLANNFPVDLRINHLAVTSGEDKGYTVVRELYKRGLANAMPYSGSARTLPLKESVEYLQNDTLNGRLTSLYSANSERDVVAVGNSTNHIDDTLLVAERLAGYKIMRDTSSYSYTTYIDKECCIMHTCGIGSIPSEEPEDVDSIINSRIEKGKKIIDDAIKYGCAINFFTHQVAKKSQKGESDYNNIASYYEAVTAILSYAKEKEKEGKLRIMSMYNIAKELGL